MVTHAMDTLGVLVKTSGANFVPTSCRFTTNQTIATSGFPALRALNGGNAPTTPEFATSVTIREVFLYGPMAFAIVTTSQIHVIFQKVSFVACQLRLQILDFFTKIHHGVPQSRRLCFQPFYSSCFSACFHSHGTLNCYPLLNRGRRASPFHFIAQLKARQSALPDWPMHFESLLPLRGGDEHEKREPRALPFSLVVLLLWSVRDLHP